jgi:cell division protease FtsH
VGVPSPDLRGREEILRVHAKIVKLGPEVDFKVIARRTPGFVGADLANLVNEAALLAARRNKPYVELPELEEAIERVIAGPERKNHMITEREKKIVAYHESGHALVAKLTPGTDPVHKVSIIPRGPALGYTLQLPTEDRFLTSRTELKSKLYVLLGGRAAEELVFKEMTTGACNDLEKSTGLAQKMVCEFGMSDKLGPMTFRKKEEEVFLGRDINRGTTFSNETGQMIDAEVKQLIMDGMAYVRKLLSDNRSKLDRLAEKLMEKEILDSDEVDSLIREGGPAVA